MNREAEKCLSAAEVALVKGDSFYRVAASEIAAAKMADTTLTNAEVARRLGRSKDWVGYLLEAWARFQETGVFSLDWKSGTNVRSEVFEKKLADAPIEEVERAFANLPQERRAKIERALVETHPAHQTKTPLGVGDSVRALEANTSFVMLMGGSLSRLADGVDLVRATWDKFEHQASDEEKEIVQEQIRDAIASLLSINSDPQELLR